ncbi:hypothetical protein L7Q78_10835, partial [Achromobacter xylosoxidans]|nr:hypothetical protein [Achromobacter xylosoxidans]
MAVDAEPNEKANFDEKGELYCCCSGFPQSHFPCGKSMLYRTLCVIAAIQRRTQGESYEAHDHGRRA